MARINRENYDLCLEILRRVEQLDDCPALEDCMQKFARLVYQGFQESIVLARVFATVPFEELPVANQRFVKDLANKAGISALIGARTPVLSLVGTYGVESTWQDRSQSKGHVGIPLVSGDFVDSIPMMSRLLKQLGFDLSWLAGRDLSIAKQLMGSISGVFYVEDASITTDNQGRRIISSQDFVDSYGIKTVFGMGGAYPSSETFITVILFTRDTISQKEAERYGVLVNGLKLATMDMNKPGGIFRDSPAAACVA